MSIKTVLNKPPMNVKMIFRRREKPLRQMPKKIRKNSRRGSVAVVITAAGTLTDNRRKKENTAGVNIRTGSAPKLLILNVIFR